MIENYSWELYYINTDDGPQCLPCACQRYIDDPTNWLELTTENIAAYDFERMRQAPHVSA